MPIDVTCPGCHKRFKVSDKFAGQKGPCPKCKTVMEIPKADEQVVIHAPEDFGPKDAKGRSVLKTAKRKDTKFNPLVAAAAGGVVLLVLLGAILMRGMEEKSDWVLGLGAALVGPLVAWAGYPALRDQELEPYAGTALWARAAACGLAFAAGWGVYSYVGYFLGGGDWPIVELGLPQMFIAAAFAVVVGGLGAFAALDLEPLVAGVHCVAYFAATILLRLIMGLDALPGIGGLGF